MGMEKIGEMSKNIPISMLWTKVFSEEVVSVAVGGISSLEGRKIHP